MGLEVEERPLAIDALLEGIKTGQVAEVFGVGTAAVVSPVGALGYRDELIKVGDGSVGPWTQKLYDALTGIQYGRQPDPFGWMQRL